MMFQNRRLPFLAVVIGGIIALLLIGCQGSGGDELSLADPAGEPVSAELTAGNTPLPAEGMPSLSGISEPTVWPKLVASQNNYMLGREAVTVSPTGTSIGIDNLILTSTADQAAWGVWRWGRFADGIMPQQLIIWASTQLTNEFWLFLSNYDTGRWELMGPLIDGSFDHTYSAPERYVSPAGFTYVALVTADGNVLDIQNLNITSDKDVKPPPAPQNLRYVNLHPTTVALLWDKDFSSGLYRYRFYSGPAPSFKLSDAGVEYRGQAEVFVDDFAVGGLVPETEYCFCMTVMDMSQNESAQSNFVVFTTPPMPAWDPPTGLTVIDTGSSWVELAWMAPTDPLPLGYNAYTGPDTDFIVDETGVVQRNHGLIESTVWRMTDLLAETEYHAAVQAYYDEGASRLSNIVTFTTESSLPPTPRFTVDPVNIQAGVQLRFDPTDTTDGDTPSAELIFKWDFENDGIVDKTTVGPEVVKNVYNDRGPVTAKLTVSDGTPVAVTEDLIVGMRYEYILGAEAVGLPGSVLAIDTEPASSRIAILLDTGVARSVRYYNGTFWQTISAGTITDDFYLDVALNPTGVSLLTADFAGGAGTWYLLASTGGAWSLVHTESITAETLVAGRLDISTGGRAVVAALSGELDGGDMEYQIQAWHERSDGVFASTAAMIGEAALPVFDTQRNVDESYILYCRDEQVHQWTIDDASTSDLEVQDLTGSATFLATGSVPDDPSKLYWAAATDVQRIYYGDNYGLAVTSEMYLSTDYQPTGLLGVGLTGDNGSFFIWSDQDASDIQYLRGCSPIPNGANEVIELFAGVGAVDGGVGAFFAEDEDAGIYTVANERRDGEVTGRFVVIDTVVSTDVVYTPVGANDILTRHQALQLTDGTLLGLAEQSFATARVTFLPFFSGTVQSRTLGVDNWIRPDTACPTRYAGEFFTGSYTGNGALVLHLCNSGNSTGNQKAIFTGTELAQLAYNPFSTNTILCYATMGNQDLSIRHWGGITWSDPVVIYSGNSAIEAMSIVGNQAGNWGVVFLDADNQLILIESDLQGWLSPIVLSTEEVNGTTGIGFDYNTSGQVCVAVERDGGVPGIYLCAVTPGDTPSWQKVVDPAGAEFSSLAAFFHLDIPVLLYYQAAAAPPDGRINFVEDIDGAWVTTVLPDQIHGAPVDYFRNVYGDVIIAGYRFDGATRRAALGIVRR